MMTPTQRHDAREALFVLKIDGSTGDGGRLNNALATDSLATLRGNTDIIAFVRSMRDRVSGEPYVSALNACLSDLGATLTTPQNPTQAPIPPATTVPTPGSFLPLTTSEIIAVNEAMKAGIDAGLLIVAESQTIADQLSRGVYSLGDRKLIDAVKLWMFNPAIPPAMKDSLDRYRRIIDQRNPDKTDETLPIGDPRWKPVVGAATPSQPATTTPGTNNPPPPAVPSIPVAVPDNAILAALQAAGIFVDLDTKCIGINGPPIKSRVTEGQAMPGIKLTLWSKGMSGIAFVGNTALADPQRRTATNPDGDPQRLHVRITSMGGDGGDRDLDNCIYADDGTMYIPDGYRNVSNRGTDSMGHDSWDETPVLPNPDGSGRVDTSRDIRGQVQVLRPHDADVGNNPSMCYGEPGARPFVRRTSPGMPQSAFDDNIDIYALRDAVRALGGNV